MIGGPAMMSCYLLSDLRVLLAASYLKTRIFDMFRGFNTRYFQLLVNRRSAVYFDLHLYAKMLKDCSETGYY